MLRSATGIVTKVSRSVLDTVRHPIASTSYAAGVVRGLAAEGIRLASGSGPRQEHDQQTVSSDTGSAPTLVPLQPGERHEAEVAAAVQVDRPVPTPGEVFANEPHAASRGSAHGDGSDDDAEVDRWQEDAEDLLAGEDLDLTPETDDQPLLDPSVAKQVRSEAETMQQAARTDVD